MIPEIPRIIYTLILGAITLTGFSADYYWIGGSGDWSDIRHWVTTSGGTSQHTSVPSSADNVYFDANSFTGPNQRVIIDFPNVFCRNIDWTGATGNPALEGDANVNLNVGGSIVFTSMMQWSFLGNVILVGVESGFVINTFGHRFNQSLIFDAGGNGAWELTSKLEVDSMILFKGGAWNTGNQEVICERLFAFPGTGSVIDFTSSHITITGETLDKRIWNEEAPCEIEVSNLTLNAVDATFEFTASISDIIVTGGISPVQFGTILFSNTDGGGHINDLRWRSTYSPISDIRFKGVTYQNNGYIGPVSGIETLELAPGKSYIFYSGMSIDMKTVTALGDCANPIRMISQHSGQQTTFKVNQPQTLDFVNLRGIKIVGAQYTANNASDLGNNEGWTINHKTSQDLYWIGGNGRWSDPSHWSYSDGGASSGCIPSASDNVFFTDNSFPGVANRVIVDIDNALCKNMTWQTTTRSPVLSGGKNRNIHLFGSLVLEPNLSMAFLGDFHFETRQMGQTIISAGIVYPKNVYFNGPGEYILQDLFEVRDSIVYNIGTLRTNDQDVVGERFMSYSVLPRKLFLGNSTITMRTLDLYHYVAWEIDGTEFELDAGTSTIFLNSAFSGRFFQRSYDKAFKYHRLININGYKNLDHSNNNSEPVRLYFDYVKFTGYGNLFGELNIKKLEFQPGYAYKFGDDGNENIFEVDTLISNGSCDAYITIESYKEGDLITLTSDVPYRVQYTLLHYIRFESPNGESFADNSLDLGWSPGWIIQQLPTGRDLYWVGGEGNWHDPAHWSLASGGPGGECIPTPSDNVFVDDNSFTGDNQKITNDSRDLPVECLNFLWTNSNNTSKLELDNLNLYGSIWVRSDPANFYIQTINLRGERSDNEIDLRGYLTWTIQVLGKGDWTFISDVECGYIYMTNGQLHLGDHNNIHVQYRVQANQNASQDVKMIGGQSKMAIDNTGFIVYGKGFTLVPDSLEIEFTGINNQIYLETPQKFHNVIFSNSEGEGLISTDMDDPEYGASTFNKLTFNNDGRILQANQIDSLLFTPGHTYTLLSDQIQTINEYWRIRGNNCGRIQLRASTPGSRAITSMATGEVNGDFIQMQDQNAIGGATFFAGFNSTNVNNSNSGWSFDTKEEFVDFGILGQDIVLCEESSIILNEENSIGATAYEWQDGSTGSSFEVNQPGDYYLVAKFATAGSECVFIDSIRILSPQQFEVDLGPDQVLCEGDSFFIDGNLDLVGATYQWKDGLDQPHKIVKSGGTYTLSATLTGCSSSDSIAISYVAIPTIELSENKQFCEGDTFVVDVTNPNASYQWNTGANTPVVQITTGGTYSVQVESNGCIVGDTFAVTFIDIPKVNLGNDTLLCEGEIVNVDGSVVFDSIVYLWSDGRAGPVRTISEPGLYQISASINQCASTDSILVEYVLLPPLSVEKNTIACEGDTLIVDVTIPGGTYQWSTGSTDPVLSISSTGNYGIQVERQGCTVADSFSINFIAPPEVDLGPPLTVCAHENVVLDAFVDNAEYLWDDGATTSTHSFMPVQDLWKKVTVSFGSCASVDSIQITVKPLPDLMISEDQTICPGTSTHFSAQTNGDSLVWSTGERAEKIDVSQPGPYFVDAYLDGCVDQRIVNLDLFATQFKALIDDTLICDDKSIILDVQIPGAMYKWSDGTIDPTLEATEGTYSVEVFDGNCSFRDTVLVTTRECTYFSLFVPNIFTPNQDGSNDNLQVNLPKNLIVNEYIIQIFNRWGSLVYESSDPSDQWNGISQGKEVPQGVYMGRIFIDYIDDNGPAQYRGGMDITIVR